MAVADLGGGGGDIGLDCDDDGSASPDFSSSEISIGDVEIDRGVVGRGVRNAAVASQLGNGIDEGPLPASSD